MAKTLQIYMSVNTHILYIQTYPSNLQVHTRIVCSFDLNELMTRILYARFINKIYICIPSDEKYIV